MMAAGIETFLPEVARLQRWSDRKKLVRFPLFPGYLFIHTDNSHGCRLTVLKTKGVVSILGTLPGEPEPVPEEQILSLQKIIASKADLDPHPYLKEGQRVRIRSGPLEGVEGILVQKTVKHMLIISIDILQRSTAVTIEGNDVEGV